MSFKKNLEPEDVSISSFQVHKTFTFTEADSGSGVYGFSIAKGTDTTLHNFDAETAVSKSFGTGSADTPKTRTFFSTPTYEVINKLYYRDINQMQGGIDFVRGVPTGSSAIITYSHTNKRAFSRPTFSIDLRRLSLITLGAGLTCVSIVPSITELECTTLDKLLNCSTTLLWDSCRAKFTLACCSTINEI